MESKELPTIEQYQDEYAKSVGHHNWTEFCAFESKGTIIQEVKKMAHEYAVLFARHHRKDMIEAVNKSIYVSFDCDIVDQERIEKIIENAYPESNIV